MSTKPTTKHTATKHTTTISRKQYVDEDSSDLSKCLLLAFVIISLILCGGSVFGFTALKDVLLDEGVYEELCEEAEDIPCASQLLQLNQMFTLAGSLFSAYLFPAGLCLRFLGPRSCFLAGFVCVFVGSLLFAEASTSFYTLAYVCIGTGNPLLYIAAFNFSKMYPQSSNLLLSILIGCFGFSSVVFEGFRFLHFHYGIPVRQIFMGFAVLPVLLGIIGWFVLPPDPYHIQREKKLQLLSNSSCSVVNEHTPLTSKRNDKKDDMETATTNKSSSDTSTTSASNTLPFKQQSILQQLLSPQFLAQTLFFSWGMLQQNFYLATIGDQIFAMALSESDQEEAQDILQKFAIGYPMGCLIAILPVGALVRNCSVSTSLFVYCTANLLFSLLVLVPSVTVQWFTSELYVLVRVAFFTVMSTYSATIFGFPHLGTIFGTAGSCAGLCSLLGGILSDWAEQNEDIHHGFGQVNTLLLGGAILSFALPTVVAWNQWQQ